MPKNDYVAKKQGFKMIQSSITKTKRDGTKKRYGVSIGKDDKGYFAYTHRARSKSYESKKDIPHGTLRWIESTG